LILEFYVIGADFADCFIDIGRIEIEDMASDVVMKAFCAVYSDVLNASVSTEHALEFSKKALPQT
jgi:hypothetical protein